MMPVLPTLSQMSGASRALLYETLMGIASIAIYFINLNKYSRYRKNFLFLSGTAGNLALSALSLTNKKWPARLSGQLGCK